MNEDDYSPVTTMETRPSALNIWFLAARPKTLWAGVAPVLMGTGVAIGAGGFHLWSALMALFGALFIQIGTNYCNDYADFKKGADTAERIGPMRATQAGWVTPHQMAWATGIAFALAALAGAYMVYRGGWPMLAITVIAIVAGILYTAGPYALAYLGLGDIFVLIFFGPVAVAGTFYIQAGEWPLAIWLIGLAPGLLSCAILAINNLRDVDQDRQAQKRTVAVRFGAGFARAEYLACMVVGIVAIPLYNFIYRSDTFWSLLPLLALSVALKPMQIVWQGTNGAALNPVLGQTARVLLLFALLFTSGEVFDKLLS